MIVHMDLAKELKTSAYRLGKKSLDLSKTMNLQDNFGRLKATGGINQTNEE